jgi:hypothetical protein
MKKSFKVVLPVIVIILAGLMASPALQARALGPFVEPDAAPSITFNGELVGDGFGWVAENLGDINHDGINDVIISANLYPVEGTPGGKAYVYSGADGELLNAVTGKPYDQFGYSASTAGYVDGDEVPDYIVGGRGTGGIPEPYKGRAVVYSGEDHSVIGEIDGPVRSGFGFAATRAGDVNGDGYGDVIIGAPFLNGTTGRVYLYSVIDRSVVWMRDGKAQGDFLGTAVGYAGDVNHDGAPDVVAGAFGAGIASGGEVYVYSGVDGRTLLTLTPKDPGTSQSFGLFFASGAGDVNRDGTPDIYVGDFANKRGGGSGSPNKISAGRVYIFSGVDGSILYMFNAEDKGDGLGPMRGAGDVNGDGYADLVIAAYNSSAGAPSGGKIYIRSGRDGAVLRTITGKISGDQLGFDALAVGDVTNDGLTDYLLTAAGNSQTGNDIGRAYIVPGIP